MSTPLPSYSERLHGAAARTQESLPEPTAEGLKALVSRRIDGDFLAEEFPTYCSDGDGIDGTNQYSIGPDLTALVPGSTWPLWQEGTTDETLFDIVEYVGQRVSKPSNGRYHEYFRHYELEFDAKAGRAQFRSEVNAILSRGGTVFEMDTQMQVQRVGSPEVQAALRQLRPASGDSKLDELLETARKLYLSRKSTDRATAIEKLWDAFERLKTLDDPSDKKRSVKKLLGHIQDSAFRDIIEAEMTSLTALGNTFQIRHHEVGKHPVPVDGQDYLAARMGNLIVLLLDQSGRLAAV
ncbi:hypothetical protein [Microbacterium maritypicum]